MGDAPPSNAAKADWVEYAVARGLDRDEAEACARDELVEMFGDDDDEGDAAYQDQGSLDQPVQSTEPTPAANDVGTEELREEARQRLSGVNRSRTPFPWEVPPPRR